MQKYWRTHNWPVSNGHVLNGHCTSYVHGWIFFFYNLHVFTFQMNNLGLIFFFFIIFEFSYFFIKHGVVINDYANKDMTMRLEMFSYILYALCSTIPLK